MTILRSTTACVSLLILAGCVAVPASGPPPYAPAYSPPPPGYYNAAPVYVVPPPRHYEPPRSDQDHGRPPHDWHQNEQRQDTQRPSNYSRSLGGSQNNPNVGQP